MHDKAMDEAMRLSSSRTKRVTARAPRGLLTSPETFALDELTVASAETGRRSRWPEPYDRMPFSVVNGEMWGQLALNLVDPAYQVFLGIDQHVGVFRQSFDQEPIVSRQMLDVKPLAALQ